MRRVGLTFFQGSSVVVNLFLENSYLLFEFLVFVNDFGVAIDAKLGETLFL